MDAEKYKNRYRAIIEFANGAMFNVAELDAWATQNKVPIAFQKLLSSDGMRGDPHHHFVSHEILSSTIASSLVPEDMDPSDAKVQLMAAHDSAEPSNPVSRLRDLVMLRYDRLLLCAVYDGELNLYDTLTYTKIDVNVARLGYSENPDGFLQSARARILGATEGPVTPVQIVATLFIDPARKHVPVGAIAEMTARAVHPKGGIEWAAAFDYHRKELDAAIRRGEIRGFEPSTMRPLTGQLTSLPLKGAPLANAWVPVEDVQKFATGVGVKVTFDFSEVNYEFVPEVRAAIAGESHWSEKELEALCLGVPPTQYDDDCVPEAERVPMRQAILSACKSGKLDAHETGTGNAVYGGKWSIERVSAVRWAITNHFNRFPEWLARSCHAEIWKRQDEERRTAGRYTLQEAAHALEQHTGTTAKDWLVKLEQAVRNDHLPMHRPGEQARYRPKTVRAYYDEAYWDDLNTWLEKYEPRITFQFLAPVAGMNPNTTNGTTDVKPCPDQFTLYWLNRKIDEDASFVEQAALVLQRMNEQRPKVLHDSTTPTSGATALVNEWLVNRDLPCYMQGRLVEDFAALTLEPASCNLSDTMDILEGSIQLHRDDVVKLLEREGMSVPHFLRCEKQGHVKPLALAGRPVSVAVEPVAGNVTDTPAPKRRPERESTSDEKRTEALANPAIQAILMFLVGTALTLGDVHSRAWAKACWWLTGVLILVAVFQWLRWPGNYGRKWESIWYLRWGGRVSLRKAAEIIYSEARAQDSVWAHAAERMSLDKSPDGILCYIAEVVKQDTVIYGMRPPSTHVEKLDPLKLKYGTVKNGAREVHMRDNTKAVFTDLEVDAKELRRALREVRESLRTTTPI
jgi:hypothetical protein